MRFTKVPVFVVPVVVPVVVVVVVVVVPEVPVVGVTVEAGSGYVMSVAE